jgi:hypothetical protein
MPSIAGSCIISVLGAIAIARSGANFDKVVIIWLVYTVTAGAIINYREGLREMQFFWYSLPPPSALVMVLVYRMVFLGDAPLTGKQISFAKPTTLAYLIFFWFCTVLGVWLFAHARNVVLGTIKSISSISKKRQKSIESTLHWVIRLVGAGYLLIKAFLNV